LVELRHITASNFDEIIRLKAAADQTGFVSTVVHSLAQAWVYRDTAFPFAVYADDVPVGFVMLGYYEARKQYTLWKLLIDEKHQNKGYGKQALRLAAAYLAETFHPEEIYTGVCQGNACAKHIYLSFGFEATGRTEDGVEELRYRVRRDSFRE